MACTGTFTRRFVLPTLTQKQPVHLELERRPCGEPYLFGLKWL